MRIALTTGEYNKNGGISRYVAELAEGCAERGYEVHIYTSKWNAPDNDDVKCHIVPNFPSSLPRLFTGVGFSVQNSVWFGIKNGYDIVHTNGCESICQDVITAHSIHLAGMEHKRKYGLTGLGILDAYNLWVERTDYMGRRYKKIICDSTTSKMELMKYYRVPERDISVIPLGVNKREFYPVGKQKYLMDRYGIKYDDFVLLIVATEFSRKGVPELIKSTKILADRGYKVKLIVVGKPGQEGNLDVNSYYRGLVEQAGIKDRVVFTGKVSDLNEHYSLADVFVFPTKYEAFGIPLLEAMSCRLPVICTNIGAGELITDGKDGMWLNDPNDVNEIADKVGMILDDYDLRCELGFNARTTAEKYSWENTVEQTIKVYEEVYGKKR